jgi:hypothetical protein
VSEVCAHDFVYGERGVKCSKCGEEPKRFHVSHRPLESVCLHTLAYDDGVKVRCIACLAEITGDYASVQLLRRME